MSDLMDETIEITCPKCGYKTKVKLKDAKDGKTVHCRSCQSDIKLEPDASFKKCVRSIDDMLKNFKF